MHKKVLQNTLFAAMAAWALYGFQAQAQPAGAEGPAMLASASAAHWAQP